MLIAIGIGLSLIGVTAFMHFHVLHVLSKIGLTASARNDRHILYFVLALFAVHAMQIVLYAAAYWFSTDVIGIGTFAGAHTGSALDLFYVSIVSYTSLGIGDIAPVGHVRFIVGVEALNGLLLIAWSASFMYMMMEQNWRRSIASSKIDGSPNEFSQYTDVQNPRQ